MRRVRTWGVRWTEDVKQMCIVFTSISPHSLFCFLFLRSGWNINTDIDRKRHPICFYSLHALIDMEMGNMQAHVKVFPSHMELVRAILTHSAVCRMTEVGLMKFPLCTLKMGGMSFVSLWSFMGLCPYIKLLLSICLTFGLYLAQFVSYMWNCISTHWDSETRAFLGGLWVPLVGYQAINLEHTSGYTLKLQ